MIHKLKWNACRCIWYTVEELTNIPDFDDEYEGADQIKRD